MRLPGNLPEFYRNEYFRRPFRCATGKIFDYVCLHPQLCVGDGEEFLKVLLSGGETEKLYVAACDPQMQCKMFRDAFEAVGFDKTKHFALDIRNKTTDEAVEAIKKLAEENP